jgi:competence protein ComEC
MSKVHLLNVNNGDSTIFEHASNRVTMIDICAGNIESDNKLSEASFIKLGLQKPKGNYGMCKKPTNPINYLQNVISRTSIFRFILTHPDMDHLDGFNNLVDYISINNFWDSGARKEKPDFSGSPYKEEDWDRYIAVRDNKEDGVTSCKRLAGARFTYANKNEDDSGGGDGLYILAPNQNLVDEANKSDDFNDCSYVILYRSAGGNIIIAGDAHDKTWEFILENNKKDLENCKFLLAPHHGRKSDRDYSFLDTMKPKLTLFGCAPSEHLAYSAWTNRNLEYVTQNQCGNMVLETDGSDLDVYIENEKFARELTNSTFTNSIGYFYITTL